MRLSAKNVLFTIAAVPNPLQPIRFRTGGLTYCLSVDEALDLATQLADAVDQAKKHDNEGANP